MIGFDPLDGAYIAADLVKLVGNVPLVGQIEFLYQVFSSVDYAVTTRNLGSAVSKGNGVVLENSFNFVDPTGYQPYKKQISYTLKHNIRQWTNYPYMDNDYTLYGTYDAN